MKRLQQMISSYYFSLKLRNKFLIPTLGVLFISFLLFTFYIIRDQRVKFERNLAARARTLSFLISHSNSENVWNYNEGALRTSCEAFFRDPEVIAIQVGENLEEPIVNLRRAHRGSKEIVEDARLLREGDLLGIVRVALTNEKIEEDLAAIRNKFLTISLAIFILIALLISYLSSLALIPLKELRRGAQQLIQGDLSHEIRIESKDELGEVAKSFNRMLTELVQHKEHLEELVARRTGQLSRSNKKLSAAMDELWGEMELAKKIQVSLLPQTPRLSGYEISASLEPADKIGGDYYDVINVDGYDWIIIGDVSGHGVPAGLIMMMVQTSIHTVLEDNPKLSASRLLTIINKTIYSNISRLGETKYMTLTVLAGMQDGKFSFSGLHQDILVYRARADQVDAIETYGMWLGIEYDIADMLEINEFELGIGDTMVLYTDGVTEARDAAGRMYEDEGLTVALRQHGSGSAAEIHDAIIAQLKNYKKPDDATLVVIKRVGE